jgi:hypothetical protein
MKTTIDKEQLRLNAKKLIADKKLIYQFLNGKITQETLRKNGIKSTRPI